MEKSDGKLVMKYESEGWNNADYWMRTPPNSASNISGVTGVNELAAKEGKLDADTPDDNRTADACSQTWSCSSNGQESAGMMANFLARLLPRLLLLDLIPGASQTREVQDWL